MVVNGGVSSGDVAPYIDIDLVFVAAARCISPESLDTQNSEICIKSTASVIEVSPHKLITFLLVTILSPIFFSLLLPSTRIKKSLFNFSPSSLNFSTGHILDGPNAAPGAKIIIFFSKLFYKV